MKKKLLFAATALVAVLAWSCSDDDKDPGGGGSQDVSTIAELQSALNSGKTTVNLKNNLTADANITIPKIYEENTMVKLTIPAAGKNVTVNQATSGGNSSFPVVDLHITTLNGLTVNTSNCNVHYTGDAQKITASTAEEFVINKGSYVKQLAVSKGNAKVFGVVDAATNSGSGKLFLGIGENSDRPAAADVIKNSMAVSWAQGLLLAEGSYNVRRNSTIPASVGVGSASDLWYLPITKDGFEIVGDGERDDIIIYSDDYSAVSGVNTQNFITVFASNVRIEGVTIQSKEAVNKAIEVRKDGFTLYNCAILPSDENITNHTNYAGSVMFSPGATSGRIEKSYFKIKKLPVVITAAFFVPCTISTKKTKPCKTRLRPDSTFKGKNKTRS